MFLFRFLLNDDVVRNVFTPHSACKCCCKLCWKVSVPHLLDSSVSHIETILYLCWMLWQWSRAFDANFLGRAAALMFALSSTKMTVLFRLDFVCNVSMIFRLNLSSLLHASLVFCLLGYSLENMWSRSDCFWMHDKVIAIWFVTQFQSFHP